MAQLMTLVQLVKIAAAAGITLTEVGRHDKHNLYVITDPDAIDLYVGKSTAQKKGKRADDYLRWAELDQTEAIHSGIVALLRENGAAPRCFSYDPGQFEPSRMAGTIARERWVGGAIDRVQRRADAGTPPTVEEVEEFLVRVHVRTGRLIGNSAYASQWEGPIGRYADTAAVLAVDAARGKGILPPGTDIPVDDLDAKKADE